MHFSAPLPSLHVWEMVVSLEHTQPWAAISTGCLLFHHGFNQSPLEGWGGHLQSCTMVNRALEKAHSHRWADL